jgi:hypothetical protein
VSGEDVGGAQIITGGFSAPNIDLAALFGEADAAAFEGEGSAGSGMAGKKAVKMAEGALGVEADDADVGWAMEDEEVVEEEAAMEDDLGLDDLLDDAEEDVDEEMEEEAEPVPAPPPARKGKRSSASGPGAIVSVAPPSKKGKHAKSVAFASAPLGPTGSTVSPAASAPSAATSNKQQFLAEAGDMSTKSKSKQDLKKAKKKAAKKAAAVKEVVDAATKEFGEDAELPSRPQPAKRVSVGTGGTSQAYDMTEFFGPNA